MVLTRSIMSLVAAEMSPVRLATRPAADRAVDQGSRLRRESAKPTPTAAPIATPIQIALFLFPLMSMPVAIDPPNFQFRFPVWLSHRASVPQHTERGWRL